MSKISFSKLNAKTNQKVNTVTYNDCEIEVKEYVSIAIKMEAIEKIVNNAMSINSHYYNPGEIEIELILALIECYTNITFTEKQQAEKIKIYDSLVSSGLAKTIIAVIEDSELNSFQDLLDGALKSAYGYRNSIFGIVEDLSQDYSNLNLEATTIRDTLGENTEALRTLQSLISNE